MACHSANSRNARRVAQSFKTLPCRNYTMLGTCPFGHQCRFAHGIEELRVDAPQKRPQRPWDSTESIPSASTPTMRGRRAVSGTPPSAPPQGDPLADLRQRPSLEAGRTAFCALWRGRRDQVARHDEASAPPRSSDQGPVANT